MRKSLAKGNGARPHFFAEDQLFVVEEEEDVAGPARRGYLEELALAQQLRVERRDVRTLFQIVPAKKHKKKAMISKEETAKVHRWNSTPIRIASFNELFFCRIATNWTWFLQTTWSYWMFLLDLPSFTEF